ncbi:Diacylglycerol lipase-alpha (DAGL-alpha) (DGL-alpha) (Neural stem cell-derived dendrite regulator) (Sn1-specific diacylglycerol lipase alpha) [Durusdinium trenchii]|uniref:sn-1-specific diacylglycerol lipase n=1 Tax=Durusdinium trenchii TaxID=1381693 RepID=A0ABP0M1U8_9DINO
MPRLQVGGQGFNIGSDDFFLPGLVGMMNRTVWTVLNVLFVVLARGGTSVMTECDVDFPGTEQEEQLYRGFALYLIISVGTLLAYTRLVYDSTRGTPLDEEKRKNVPNDLLILVAMMIPQMVAGVLFAILASNWPDVVPGAVDTAGCEALLEQKFVLLVVALVFIWLDVVVFFGSAYLFLHRYDVSRKEAMYMDDFEQNTVRWQNCFQFWCRATRLLTCNLFGFVTSGDDAEEVYHSVGEVFNTWFSGTDMTITDLVAAAILVRIDQRKERRNTELYKRAGDNESSYVPGAKARKKGFRIQGVRALAPLEKAGSRGPDSLTARVADDIDDEDEDKLSSIEAGMAGYIPPQEALESIKMCYEYVHYMVAMYGWKLALYSNMVRMQPVEGLRKVLKLPSPRKERRLGAGDNCIGCSEQALLTHTEVTREQVIYATYSSVSKDTHAVQVPHAVIVDHERQTVVITMRGTMSLQDLMTDFMVEPASLSTCGSTWGFDGGGHYAHAGMLKIAMRIRAALEHNKVLHQLLGVEPTRFDTSYEYDPNDDEAKPFINWDALPNCRGYQLKVLGHSLGGGVASLLCLMLRPSFPGATCIAYAGPGAMMSYKLSVQSREWCTNIYLGDDMIPHLNWQTLRNLKLRVFDVLYRAKVSKARIFRSLFVGSRPEDLLYEPYEVPQTEARLAILRKRDDFMNKRHSGLMENVTMHAPGVTIHLTKMETVLHKKRCGLQTRKERIYEPFWTLPEQDADQREKGYDLNVSTRILLDHFPDLLAPVLRQVLQRYGSEPEL